MILDVLLISSNVSAPSDVSLIRDDNIMRCESLTVRWVYSGILPRNQLFYLAQTAAQFTYTGRLFQRKPVLRCTDARPTAVSA